MSLRSVAGCRPALIVLAVLAAAGETRPRYGGTLRVEIREAIETLDPPQTGPGIGDLSAAFTITRWEAGTRATFAADENAPGGRPFVDGVEVQMGRPPHERLLALDTGKADIVELGPAELRRQPAGREIWSSSPVRVIALVFGPRVEVARVRGALALAVDRAAIHGAILQRQGEYSGALLPQWISGYSFVFPVTPDLAKARSLLVGVPAPARTLTFSTDEAAFRPVADRIALNARDAGLTLTAAPPNTVADVRLSEARVASSDPVRALAGIAAAFHLPAPAPADTPESLYAAERTLLDGYRVIPLFHLPVVFAVGPRVKGGPGITPLGEWRFEGLWLEGGKP